MARTTIQAAVAHHEHIINLMLHALADHVMTIMSLLKKCSCDMPVTVTNIKTNEVKCDDCCAKLVHDADKLKRIVPNPERSEKNWIDLPTAVAIRTMLTHFDQITEKDVVIH